MPGRSHTVSKGSNLGAEVPKASRFSTRGSFDTSNMYNSTTYNTSDPTAIVVVSRLKVSKL